MAKVEKMILIYIMQLEMQILKDKKTNLQQLWKNVILQDGIWSQQVPQ